MTTLTLASGCIVHHTHRPRPLRFVEHHVQPQGMGGPDVPDNKIGTCDTGHYNIHRLMGYLLKRDAPGVEPRFYQQEGGTPLEKQFAMLGYRKWVAQGRPGKPVYELDF